MKPVSGLSAFLLTLFVITNCFSQSIDPAPLHKQWNAFWIAVPGESLNGYGVYLFRKKFFFPLKPGSFIVHVSADNRYKLFINGILVSLGPARGDLKNWNYETMDVAPFLRSGGNIIAAMVWNEGEWRPEGQISLRTGLIVQGNDSAGREINTNSEWKCIRDSSYHPIPFESRDYYVAGPGEQINMKDRMTGWESFEFTDSSWKNAQEISLGRPKNIIGGYGTIQDWMLIPSVLPQMELKDQRLLKVSRSEGIQISAEFPFSKKQITIPANTKADILLDQGFLTNAYPEFIFSGGLGGTVSLSYAEALYSRYPEKGNRNETEGKIFIGRKDSIISNGSMKQVFTTLTFRTYRFIRIRVTTGKSPLTIEDIFGKATGYPFQFNARLESDNPEFNKILDIGWRTARSCAMETYMDCPYYEQLQYIGDSRIQSLVSLYNSGDERLLLNAMNQMDNSRQPEGVTLSRHPSRTPQYIPTFSLWYIGMLHDYMMYGRDSNYIKNKLAGERQILNYFRNYQQSDGSLKDVPYWMFTDWVDSKGWVSGEGPIGKNGNSSLADLQLLWAYQLAADLESQYGMSAYAALYKQYANQLKKTIRDKYWVEDRKLFSDRPEKDLFSQHANSLAILTNMFNREELVATGEKILSDSSLAPASIYFKFYLHMALVKAGLGNDYLNWLGKWRENIAMGLTTWAEISDINKSRSDCHAWGASPNIEFFRTILGIDSGAPGFAKVKIEPHLGILKNIQGEMPHPRGKIKAGYRYENNQWKIQIDLPSATTGQFIWMGRSYPLKPGINIFTLNA
jgi:alpha-L-rhamnosidase